MGRVHYNDIRLWHIRQHFVHCDLLSFLAALLFHDRVTFGLFHLLHHFFAGHPIFAKVLGPLPQVIDSAQDNGHHANQRHQTQDHPPQFGQDQCGL